MDNYDPEKHSILEFIVIIFILVFLAMLPVGIGATIGTVFGWAIRRVNPTFLGSFAAGGIYGGFAVLAADPEISKVEKSIKIKVRKLHEILHSNQRLEF